MQSILYMSRCCTCSRSPCATVRRAKARAAKMQRGGGVVQVSPNPSTNAMRKSAQVQRWRRPLSRRNPWLPAVKVEAALTARAGQRMFLRQGQVMMRKLSGAQLLVGPCKGLARLINVFQHGMKWRQASCPCPAVVVAGHAFSAWGSNIGLNS